MKIIHDLPAAEYHARPELSNSGMGLLKECPAKFKSGFRKSKAMDFGTEFHVLMLEPHRFNQLYVKLEEETGSDKRTTKYKAAVAAIKSSGDLRTPLTHDDWIDLHGMVAAIKSHPLYATLIHEKWATESSIFWEEDGIECKCRVDLSTSFIVDFKSTVAADAESFSKSVFNYGYHRQQAHYHRPFELAGTPKRFYFWAVEKEPPYLNAIYELDEAALIMGRAEREKLMALYRTCKALDRWPGLPTTIQTISLPAWAFKEKSENQ